MLVLLIVVLVGLMLFYWRCGKGEEHSALSLSRSYYGTAQPSFWFGTLKTFNPNWHLALHERRHKMVPGEAIEP